VAVDSETNTLVAGENKDLYRRRFEAADLNWIAAEILDRPRILRARIRYKHAEADAEVTPLPDGRTLVEFEKSPTGRDTRPGGRFL